MPSMAALTSRTRSIWRRSSSGVTWLPKPWVAEWSVIDDVLEAALARGLGHLLDRVAPVGGDGVHVQVAAQVGLLDQHRDLAGLAERELAAVLAQLRRDPRQAEALVDLLLGRAAVGLARRVVEDPVLADVQPLAHRRLAQRDVVRLDPVKCCRRLPNWSGSTTRRSTGIPVWVRARAAFWPGTPLIDSMTSSSAKAASSAAGSDGGGDDVEVLDAVARGAGRCRPARPSPTAGCARSASTIASAIGSALCSRTRAAGRLAEPGVERGEHAASNFGPKPLTPRRRSCSAASRSASSESMPSSSKSLRARFGPRPGSRVMSTSPGGKLRAQLLDRGDRPRLEQRA